MQLVRSVISGFGLDELWAGVERLMRDEGYEDANSILQVIANDTTPQGREYREALFRRFPAIRLQQEENARRASAGETPLPVVTAAEYVALEQSYRTALTDLPGNFASRENIDRWVAGRVAPAEIDRRVNVARQYIASSVNPAVKEELRNQYGLSDMEMVAYVLADPKSRGDLELEWTERERRANVGAAARTQGLALSESMRNEIAAQNDQSTSFGQMSMLMGQVAREQPTYEKLGAMAGEATSTDDLLREEFNLSGSSEASRMRKRLASQERGRFSGSTGLGRGSLAAGGIGSQ